MSTLRRRYKGPTKPKTCTIPRRLPLSPVPVRCACKVFKAGRCIEHYNDWRNEREANRMEPQSVLIPWSPKAEAPKPTIEQRRKRQGISQDSQDYLIRRAREKRNRRAA